MVTENKEDKNNITLSYKQIGTIILIVINILVIAPGSWFLTTLWTEARSFKNNTEEEFEIIKKDMNRLKVDLSSKYVTRQAFNNYREQMAKNMRYMDRKNQQEHLSHRNRSNDRN